MIVLETIPLPYIFAGSIVVLLLTSQLGRMVGRWQRTHGGDNVATLEGAVLGLLALMISFTFAMSLSRFDARRDALLNEANAIGTTALRARLLPAPHNAESLKLLSEYVQLRLDATKTALTIDGLTGFIDRSNAIQEALWLQAKAAAAKDSGMVPTGIFIQTLNEMIDNQEKRLTAVRNRVPNIVLLALYGIAMVAFSFSGYAAGLDARRSRLPVFLMALLVTGVILLIQDLDRPGVGYIRVSQQPMIDAANAIAGFKD